MTSTVRITPAARLEAIEAQQWCATRSAGVVDCFINALDRVVGLSAASPDGFPVLHRDLRRGRLKRFPYSLFYRVADEDCFVVACFHAKRDPLRWETR